MSLASDIFADLIKMQLQGFSVGLGQNQSGTGSPLGADGAEQVGIFVTLVCGQSWPGSLSRPDTSLAVLLPNARLILEPDLDRRFFWQIGYVGREGIGKVFLNASITRAFCSGCCGRPEMLEKPSSAR